MLPTGLHHIVLSLEVTRLSIYIYVGITAISHKAKVLLKKSSNLKNIFTLYPLLRQLNVLNFSVKLEYKYLQNAVEFEKVEFLLCLQLLTACKIH